jgi:hypothetical protein
MVEQQLKVLRMLVDTISGMRVGPVWQLFQLIAGVHADVDNHKLSKE